MKSPLFNYLQYLHDFFLVGTVFLTVLAGHQVKITSKYLPTG